MTSGSANSEASTHSMATLLGVIHEDVQTQEVEARKARNFPRSDALMLLDVILDAAELAIEAVPEVAA